jgi:hypothetical protein
MVLLLCIEPSGETGGEKDIFRRDHKREDI